MSTAPNAKQEKISDTSNPWFIVSIITTIFLILLLTWNLIYSYRVIGDFEEKELALERASGEISFHLKSLEMSILMAAFTGDLRWKDDYEEHRPQLDAAIEEINRLTEGEAASREIKKIKEHFGAIKEIEDRAFTLVSRGSKEEAQTLLKGWDYQKNQLGITESTENLKDIMKSWMNERITFQNRIISIMLMFVAGAFIILIVSWYISIKRWRENVRKRKEKEEEIVFLSYHDSLTGLYNRRYFMEVSREKISKAEDYNKLLSIIIIDIDNFKKINDNFGHNTGDLVLKKVASRLEDDLSEGGIVARLGGDEFGVVISDVNSKQAIKQIANELIASFNQPLIIDDSKFFISISIGVSIYPDDGKQLEELIKNADYAMYRTKQNSETCVFYSSEHLTS